MTMQIPLVRINKKVIYIILIGLITSFYGFWDPLSQNFTAHDESLYVGRSRMILDNENWFTPFSTPHHKTVGSYWLIALSLKIFGFSEYSARLPSGMFSVLCSLAIYFIAKEFLTDRSAFFSGLSLIAMPLWIQYSRYASPDIPYVFFILLIIFCLIKLSKSSVV